jgi:CBS domain-containing protein
MQVREIMTHDPACCSPETNIQEAAKLMADCDCGEIPVVDEQRRPLGVITDRDIACRVVAQRMDPQRTRVGDVMSGPAVTTTPEASLDECCHLMEEHQIRRIPVVDESGACCGMVSQADIARQLSAEEAGALLKDISRPTHAETEIGRGPH